MKQCDKLIEIPLYGFKNSINVATSVSVIGFRAIESMVKGTESIKVTVHQAP